MAIAFVGTASGSVIAGGDLNLPITPSAGNIVVVTLGTSSNLGVLFATITTSGYTQLSSTDSGAAPNMRVITAYKIMGGTPDTSIDFTGNGVATDTLAAVAQWFSGVDATTPIDQTTTTATGSSTNPDPPSITTVTDGAIVIACAGGAINDASVTAPSTYTHIDSWNSNGTNDVTAAMASKIIASHGAENPATYTTWSNSKWATATIALRPAAAVTSFRHTHRDLMTRGGGRTAA